MKEHLAELIRRGPATTPGRSATREYLQARILECLQRSGAMVPLAFHGGTALRFLYSLPRYSEDLDFALEGSPESYDFRAYVRLIQSQFMAEGYVVDCRVSDQRAVHAAFIRFGGLLHELGLSPHRDEVLSIKIEVDTRPPVGAGLTTTLIRRHVTLHLHHHDAPSLLAGKLHAILSRPYTKGRDCYDLFWYLADPNWPEPNVAMLNNALSQTGWAAGPVTLDNWRGVVKQQLKGVHWSRVESDVRPFLEPSAGESAFSHENLIRLLEPRA